MNKQCYYWTCWFSVFEIFEISKILFSKMKGFNPSGKYSWWLTLRRDATRSNPFRKNLSGWGTASVTVLNFISSNNITKQCFAASDHAGQQSQLRAKWDQVFRKGQASACLDDPPRYLWKGHPREHPAAGCAAHLSYDLSLDYSHDGPVNLIVGNLGAVIRPKVAIPSFWDWLFVQLTCIDFKKYISRKIQNIRRKKITQKIYPRWKAQICKESF